MIVKLTQFLTIGGEFNLNSKVSVAGSEELVVSRQSQVVREVKPSRAGYSVLSNVGGCSDFAGT